ncbi:MAG: hypothetical protein H8F28_02855 [Fibrella sp.]|nr:hypothetical protein [Armatimonadota bacterium]
MNRLTTQPPNHLSTYSLDTRLSSCYSQCATAMSAPSNPPPANNAPRASAYAGFFLFLVGMAMIAFVFSYANTLLSAAPPAVPQLGTGENAATEAGLKLGTSVIGLLQKLLILLVMSIVGSLFASRGIHLLFTAWNTKS